MGSACCCLRPEEFEELAYSNGSMYRHCICLTCFIQQLLHAYTSLFQHGENRVASPNQGATPLAAAGLVSASVDNSLSGIYRSPPRPLPYDADSRYARLQRDGLVSRREKASSHFHEESEPLRSSSSGAVESIQEKRNGADYEGHSKIVCSDSSGRHLLAKVAKYTPEDPKIMTQCSHHFHLGCIYEWMERSDNCPVCGKEMVFSESP
ncbi:E3 ubiquitin-protein ligase [Nymphaea thermarum]|nr:E3 ubiquitin-protein ligase [Nymphaea thermarum]